MVNPTKTVSVSPDDDDNRFLECAVEAGAHYLITGNKRHFPFRYFEGVKIMSAAEFMRVMLE